MSATVTDRAGKHRRRDGAEPDFRLWLRLQERYLRAVGRRLNTHQAAES